MVTGIGIDLVEIERFERAKPGLLKRLFTPAETRYCARQSRPAQHYAARFAAKEAALKAIGTGLTARMRWRDVEVLRDKTGQVSLKVSGEIRRKAPGVTWHLSMSHSR